MQCKESTTARGDKAKKCLEVRAGCKKIIRGELDCSSRFFACVAQLVEHLTFNQVVEGSIPSAGTLELSYNKLNGNPQGCHFLYIIE